MTSFAQKLFNAGAHCVQKPTLGLVAHQPTLSRIFDVTAALTTRPLRGCAQHFTALPDFRMRRMIPDPDAKNLLLYFHGGGFTIGSSFTHRWLAARLASGCDAQAWLPDYRLAPAHPYPAAPEDCLAAYRHALDTYPAERIVIAGDSAGGTLVLNTVARAHAAGLPLPAAIGLLSPLADLSPGIPTRADRRGTDMLLPSKWVDRALAAYLGPHDPADPAISPLLGDLSMMPYCALHVAEEEWLYNDAERLAEALPDMDFQVWENVPHVWQLAAGWTAEADESLQFMANDFRVHLP